MANGQQNSYTNTAVLKTVVSDRVLMTDPMEFPLMNALGLSNDDKFKFVDTPGTSYKWLEDQYSPLSDAAACTGMTNDSTTTTISVTDGTKFQPGDVIQVDSEYIWVSAISTNDLTVTRNFGGTQATHASTSTVYIRSRARLEGAAATTSHYTVITTNYNYSTIFQKSLEVSRSDARIQRYGIPNLVEYEKDKKMKELMRDLTRLPYYGTRAAGSATAPRMSGGFDTFITTNATAKSSAALTQKDIEDAIGNVWTYAPAPRLLMICNTWPKRKLADWFGGFIRTDRSETMGGVTISTFLSAIGIEVDVMVDRFCPASNAYIINPEYAGFITLDEFFYEDLGKSKDTAAYGQIVGEYGFVVAYEKAHAKITGFSTTA
jgi:hypothetical protein